MSMQEIDMQDHHERIMRIIDGRTPMPTDSYYGRKCVIKVPRSPLIPLTREMEAWPVAFQPYASGFGGMGVTHIWAGMTPLLWMTADRQFVRRIHGAKKSRWLFIIDLQSVTDEEIAAMELWAKGRPELLDAEIHREIEKLEREMDEVEARFTSPL